MYKKIIEFSLCVRLFIVAFVSRLMTYVASNFLIDFLYRKKVLVIIFLFANLIFIFLSYKQGISEDIKGDYYVYWSAGKNFLEQKDVYVVGSVDVGFNYPPFAAMAYQILALLSFHSSAILYSFVVNFLFWIFSFIILYKILKIIFPLANCRAAILFAFIASARYFLHNFIWVQANIPVLLSTLLGIFFYLKKENNKSYIFFLLGTFLKLTPVVFLFFILFNKSYKEWFKAILISIPFIILPIIFRGFKLGLNDWTNYYHAFIQPFIQGKIDYDLISFGIPSVITKMSLYNSEYNFIPLFILKNTILKVTIIILQSIFLGAITLKITIGYFIVRKKELNGIDFCLLFILPLILLGRVWEHHHVSLMFIYAFLYCFLSVRKQYKLRYLITWVAIFLGIIGLDTVGEQLYAFSQWYGFITLFVLSLTVYFIITKYQYTESTISLST